MSDKPLLPVQSDHALHFDLPTSNSHLDFPKLDNGQLRKWKVGKSIYEIQQVNGQSCKWGSYGLIFETTDKHEVILVIIIFLSVINF